MATTRQALQHMTLLANLPEDVLERIAAQAWRRSYSPGEIVILAGDPCEAVYFVTRGQVDTYCLSPSGRRQILARLGPGEAFNIAALFLPQAANLATVEAVAPTELYRVDLDRLRHLVRETPALAGALLHHLAQRVERLTGLVEDLSLRTVRGRLARFLLQHSGQEAQRHTQEEIAAHVGTVRDMVGRNLRAFAEAGLVRIERERVVLLDREGLEAEAG